MRLVHQHTRREERIQIAIDIQHKAIYVSTSLCGVMGISRITQNQQGLDVLEEGGCGVDEQNNCSKVIDIDLDHFRTILIPK